MWTKSKKVIDEKFIRDFERGVLRSAFVSTFWAVIEAKKVAEGFTLKQLADRLNINKSATSRWFSGEPNWEINTVSDIARALDVEIKVTAVDRRNGRIFTPSGEQHTPATTASVISLGERPTQAGVQTSGRTVDLGQRRLYA
jgi:transcriptional regulator with XRE-family HTH domain